MSEKTWWDPQTKVIRSQDPAKMNPQQRANWVLIQYVLDAEYQRGREDGRREAAKQPSGDYDEQVDGVLFMYTRPCEKSDIDAALKRNGKTGLDNPRPVL
ncbi:MAG: hypothetical protein IKO68_01050 [Oscillospiraceae bacterium]|nr:hypothetical protein [Oscillospiraceae bacterium]